MVFKDGDLEYDIPFWLLTLHSMKRYFLGKKLYLNKKYFLKYRWCNYGIQLNWTTHWGYKMTFNLSYSYLNWNNEVCWHVAVELIISMSRSPEAQRTFSWIDIVILTIELYKSWNKKWYLVYKRHHGLCVVLTICAFLGDLAGVVDDVDLKACSRPVEANIV